MGAISEVLNLNLDSADWRMILGNGKRGSTRKQEEGMMVHVVHAAFLPTPTETRSGMKDLFSEDRPLLGILYVLILVILFFVGTNPIKDATGPY